MRRKKWSTSFGRRSSDPCSWMLLSVVFWLLLLKLLSAPSDTWFSGYEEEDTTSLISPVPVMMDGREYMINRGNRMLLSSKCILDVIMVIWFFPVLTSIDKYSCKHRNVNEGHIFSLALALHGALIYKSIFQIDIINIRIKLRHIF